VKTIPFFNLDVNPCYFCGNKFSDPLAPNEIMSNIIKAHMFQKIVGNQIRVLNPIKMFSMLPHVTRVNV
jgi:hypothetical protein